MALLLLDHIAVAADTLEEGRAHVEDALGVTLQDGGQHPRFGTHNLLLGLDDGIYLEVIAKDPSGPPPSGPRWFDLDRFSGEPRLTNWICRVSDLDAALAQLPEAGRPVDLQRGDLRWRMAVPEDGILPFDNRFPALISWTGPDHPANRLKASGCRLRRLVVSHPDAEVLSDRLLPAMDAPTVAFEPGETAGLRAEIETPAGLRELR
ncbi:VOC family protein [Roseovarius aestuariivivens]|uniref:VOC family protein n=1 Tax=Roseovarius aestuariivivens TaxID=1888910 RepID=UPI001080E771|nr:VOC family protein [Roseovarius aestuariivivens]